MKKLSEKINVEISKMFDPSKPPSYRDGVIDAEAKILDILRSTHGLWLEEINRNSLDIPMKLALGSIYDAIFIDGKYYRLQQAKEEK